MTATLSPVTLAPPATTSVEIVVPVYNEVAGLERSIRRLHAFLTDNLPFRWHITIVDNASLDGSYELARRLAVQLDGVSAVRLDLKGRGRALRAVWLASRADLLCYMDVDLSTDLRALLPLLAPLASGHSDVAIGTRLADGARVVRGARRDFISRSYNRLLHVALGARFSDAQCGFKAIRADAARELLPLVRDDAWFFDTELLVLAQRHGLRIYEVPVDWVEDPDSRVEVLDTAVKDLRGVARLWLARPVMRFAIIGVLSTLAYAGLYLLLRGGLGAAAANALALAITAVANTQANRRFTFAARGRSGLLRQHAAGAVVYVFALAITAGALGGLHALTPHASRLVEVTVLVVASVTATVMRYLALRGWVFASSRPCRRARGGRLAPEVSRQ